MRILFVVPYAPTPIRTRPHNLLRALARRGHELTLATLYEHEREREALCALEREGIRVVAEPLTRARVARNVLGALAGRDPLQSAYCWHPALAGQLSATLARRPAGADVVHVEHLRGARYALGVQALAPTVWDSVDCISHLFGQASAHSRSARSRLMAAFESPRTRRYEARLSRQFARVLVTSDADRRALEALAPGAAGGARIAVLPNGVDLERFRPEAGAREPDRLVISGKMSYHANVSAALHFAREVLPLIWRERPQTRLWIAGQNPPDSVRALGADARIQVTGTVPELRDYVARASVAVCPLVYGAGIQNKVLEAMACATPVVSYTRALEAIAAEPEREVLAADSAPGFARQVLRLLADPDLARRTGAAGRDYVAAHHRWSDVSEQLETIYVEARSAWNYRTHRQP